MHHCVCMVLAPSPVSSSWGLGEGSTLHAGSSGPCIGRCHLQKREVFVPLCAAHMFADMFRYLLISLAILQCLASNTQPGPRCELSVNTTSGVVEGHLAPNRSSVVEYLGIKYAHAANGTLRFAPPKPYRSHEVFNASHFSADCPANIAPVINYPPLTSQGSRILQKFLFQNNNHTQSEDCLTLNIWTKSPHKLPKPKAVLIFHHGGRFQIPGSNSPFYNGQYLVDAEDVVVVTFNKRESILGFPGVTPNLGLLDFRLVVEWVRDNIAEFGGDPKRITIWGQSAGGVAVDAYAYAYREDPIVHGLIPDSGVAFNLTPTYAGEQEQYFLNVSSIAGCPQTEKDAVLECMRQLPFQTILNATRQVRGSHLYQGVVLPVFRPTVDNITIFDDYVNRSRNGSFARIPVLLSDADHESGFYRITSFAQNITKTERGWQAWEAYNFYCPTQWQAYWRRKHGVPTWTYRYFGDWENLRLYNTSGAYHGTELDMIFGTAEDVAGGVANTAEEDKLIKYMMKVYATFARDPKHGLEKLGWPQYDPMRETLVRLGYNNSAEPSFVSPQDYAEFCPPLEDPMPNYGEPPFR